MKMNVLVPLFLLFVVAAGCIGGQTQVQPKPNETPAPEDQEITTPVEETIKETPKAILLEYPTEMNANENGFFKWSISGVKGTVPHTAVHLGKVSTPIVSDASTPQDTAYTMMSEDYTSGSFTVPGEFNSYVKISEPGTYYARAHTIIDGKNVWSDEVSFIVKGEKGETLREFTVTVSDAGFEPAEIEVNKGDVVIIKFEVASEGTHQNGVRILSPAWKDAPALMPGSTYEVKFTADNSFEYRLFWLAGNLLKATGKVTVKEA